MLLGLTTGKGLRYGARDVQEALVSPMQGFDSLRIVCQIVALQCLHYLVLSLLLPPLLVTFSFNQSALNFQGGPTSPSMILDWREIAGLPVGDGGRAWPWNRYKAEPDEKERKVLLDARLNTSVVQDMGGANRWWEWDVFLQSDSIHWSMDRFDQVAWVGVRPGRGGVLDGADITVMSSNNGSGLDNDPAWWSMYARDSSRGWVIVFAWALTGVADVFLLSILIRRPTHILDHTLTLHLLHLLLTTIYTRNVPTSLFYWLVMLAHAGACVVWAEALSIKRELRTGWSSGLQDSERQHDLDQEGEGEEERLQLLASNGAPSMSQSNNRPTTHVLFAGDEGDEDDTEEGEGKGGTARQEHIEMKRIK